MPLRVSDMEPSRLCGTGTLNFVLIISGSVGPAWLWQCALAVIVAQRVEQRCRAQSQSLDT